jgi:predicted small lipoprotein YifL
MRKKFSIPIISVMLAVTLAGCGQNPAEVKNTGQDADTNLQSRLVADKIEIYVFHSTQRCISCVTIGKYTAETVKSHYKTELDSGKMVFKEINVDLPENRALANKFRASGSSLFINAMYGEKERISEDTNVWRLIQNETQFKKYLKGKLDGLLGK